MESDNALGNHAKGNHQQKGLFVFLERQNLVFPRVENSFASQKPVLREEARQLRLLLICFLWISLSP
ncbi:MAG: hypothetical protein PHW12_05090 [Smithella sp.]|nr:hypothetical protein [Smithella sp.]